MSEQWQEIAKLESLMFRQMEIKGEREKLKDESERNVALISKILQDTNTNMHFAKFNEDYQIKAEIKGNRKSVFNKEQMAEDMNVAPSATQKKDFLINMTEQRKLTLQKFKGYFESIPGETLSIRKVKIKKPKKNKKG